MPVAPINGPVIAPNAAPVAQPAAPDVAQPVAPKAVPGFDPAGAPLGDSEVWGLFVGEGAKKRPVNTAEAHGKKAIDGYEQRQLLELLKKSPKEFLQRLLADSANGSAVQFGVVKELKGFGIGRVDFRAENGHVDTKASVEIFHKAADGYLKAYLAKDAGKGERPRLALEIQGDLNKDGGIDGVKLEVRAENVPAFSAEKLQEIDKLKGELKATLEGKGRAREKNAAAEAILERAIKKASDIPVGFLISLISDNHHLEMDFKERDRSTKVHADTGEGKYAITFSDILDGDNADEVDLGARVAGSVSEDKGVIKIDEAKVYVADQLSLSWGDDGRPALAKVDAQGQKQPVNDHLGEIMMYLPMALALAGKKDIF